MTPEQYQRAKELFHAALVLTPEQRERFLQTASEGPDPTEVVNEVRSLLAHHSSQTLLQSLPTQTGTTTVSELHPEGPSSPRDTQRAASAADRPRLVELSKRLIPRIARASDGSNDSAPPFGSGHVPRSHRWGHLLWQLGPNGQLALGVAVACLLLGLAGYTTNALRESSGRSIRESVLQSALNSTVRAMELWIEQEQTRAQLVARHPELRELTEQLIRLFAESHSSQGLANCEPQTQLRTQMRETLGKDVRYAIWDRQYLTIADWSPQGDGIGAAVTPYGAALLARVFEGETVLQLPGPHPPITRDYPRLATQRQIGILTPIRDTHGAVIGALLLYGMGADERFEDILSLVQIGATGETYAFDRSATMISASRFERQLHEVGLLTSNDNAASLSLIHIRDPGAPLRKGKLPSSPPETWPMTKMARFAISGNDGTDLDGYRNYRGATVMGSWKWISAYDFGIACEIESMEARNRLTYPYFDIVALMALLGTALAGVIASYASIQQLRRQLQDSRRLGQYTLEEKIGEGGMGVVYRARHVLLKRPTAIKLLKSDVVNPRTTAWFEREAQLASRLTHPNTIAIYDYGISEQGVYYYVMEYLDGETLEQLVRREGRLSVDRAASILRQTAGSLREAHELGLVHRDIKPHNIMVCHRAGQTDFVKVLDFGLVKQFTSIDPSAPHRPSTVLAGTPIYMAPERIADPGQSDPRADIYAWGAVGYFLLTGREIFADRPDLNLFEQVLNELPTPIHCFVPEIPASLEQLMMRCLSKSAAERPATIAEAVAALSESVAIID